MSDEDKPTTLVGRLNLLIDRGILPLRVSKMRNTYGSAEATIILLNDSIGEVVVSRVLSDLSAKKMVDDGKDPDEVEENMQMMVEGLNYLPDLIEELTDLHGVAGDRSSVSPDDLYRNCTWAELVEHAHDSDKTVETLVEARLAAEKELAEARASLLEIKTKFSGRVLGPPTWITPSPTTITAGDGRTLYTRAISSEPTLDTEDW